MKSETKETWTLTQLAEETGLSPRTIRYYISRGLVKGPVIAGRGAQYDQEHLARLTAIRQLQSRGAMLAEIEQMLQGTDRSAPVRLPAPEIWERYLLGGDVVVMIRGDAAPWRKKALRKAMGQFAETIQGKEDYEDEHGGI